MADVVSDSYSLDSISEGYADMLRGDYDDYVTRFQPYENYYQGFVTDPAQAGQLREDALGYVDTSVNMATGRQAANLNAQDRKYGVSLDASEQRARSGTLGRQRSLLQAKSRTDMLSYMGDRELQMLSGGVR